MTEFRKHISEGMRKFSRRLRPDAETSVKKDRVNQLTKRREDILDSVGSAKVEIYQALNDPRSGLAAHFQEYGIDPTKVSSQFKEELLPAAQELVQTNSAITILKNDLKK